MKTKCCIQLDTTLLIYVEVIMREYNYKEVKMEEIKQEVVPLFFNVRGYDPKEYPLPERMTKKSAGYDFFVPYMLSNELGVPIDETYIIAPNSSLKIYTGVKVRLQEDTYLQIHPRSSVGNKGLMLKNTVGIIDSDYFDNPINEGNIILNLYNYTNTNVSIKAGARVAQGIISKYETAGNCNSFSTRSGGFGSTDTVVHTQCKDTGYNGKHCSSCKYMYFKMTEKPCKDCSDSCSLWEEKVLYNFSE